MPEKFPSNTGYKWIPPDPRDFILESAQPVAPFPSTYRTDTSALGIYNQLQIPDCVENGVTLVKRYFDWKSDGVNTDRSRRFLAILTAQDDGFPLIEGSNLTNALKRAVNTGICESTLLADDHTLDINTFTKVTITQEMLDNAKTAKINSYAFVGDKSFNGLKNAINQNGMVLLALYLDENWWTNANGNISWAAQDLFTNNGNLRLPTNAASKGGHVCVAVGYTENSIIIQNSFGGTWGDKGFGYLGADYIPYIIQAATIIDLTPAEYQRIVKGDQIVQNIEIIKKYEVPSNKTIIETIIAQLWQKFTDLFTKPLGLGRWAHAYGGVPRSPQWPQVRNAHLLKEPTCQLCGGNTKLNVHHILPFHNHPQLELDPNNLITLCNGGNGTIACHIRFGHFDNFKNKWNPNIRSEVEVWRKRFLAQTEEETGVDSAVA